MAHGLILLVHQSLLEANGKMDTKLLDKIDKIAATSGIFLMLGSVTDLAS